MPLALTLKIPYIHLRLFKNKNRVVRNPSKLSPHGALQVNYCRTSHQRHVCLANKDMDVLMNEFRHDLLTYVGQKDSYVHMIQEWQ